MYGFKDEDSRNLVEAYKDKLSLGGNIILSAIIKGFALYKVGNIDGKPDSICMAYMGKIYALYGELSANFTNSEKAMLVCGITLLSMLYFGEPDREDIAETIDEILGVNDIL